MKKNKTPKYEIPLSLLLVGGLLAPQTAGAAIVTTLVGLTPTQTFNATGPLTNIGSGNSNTFADADYASLSLVDVDKFEATFALTVTLATYSTTDRQTLWETGGGAIGTSLTYESGNVLVLRMSGNNGGGGGSGLLTATTAALTAGTYDLTWTMEDIGDLGSPTTPTISLYIDGLLADSDTGADWETDWSGTNNAGFGEQSGVILGTTAPVVNGTSEPFSDGSIDLTRGLEFYADTLFVPEPSSFALLGLGGLLVIARRRRS